MLLPCIILLTFLFQTICNSVQATRSSDAAPKKAIEEAISKNFGKENAQKAAADLESELDIDAMRSLGEQITDDVNQAPVVKLVNSMIEFAVRANASDIHVEPMADRIRVRIRIDGVLSEIMSNPIAARDAIITRLKILSGLNIAEKRILGWRIQTMIGVQPMCFHSPTVRRRRLSVSRQE